VSNNGFRLFTTIGDFNRLPLVFVEIPPRLVVENITAWLGVGKNLYPASNTKKAVDLSDQQLFIVLF